MLSDPRPVVICYYFHYLPGNWVWLQFLCAVKIWGDLPLSSPIIAHHHLCNHYYPSITHCLSLWSFSHKLERQRTIEDSGSEANLLRGRQDFDGGTKEQYFYWFIISDCIYVPRNIINTLEVPHRTVSQDKGQSLSLTMSGSNEPLSHRLSHIFMCIFAQAKQRDPSSYIEELGFVQRFYISGPQRVI